jgi:hypothetical protein
VIREVASVISKSTAGRFLLKRLAAALLLFGLIVPPVFSSDDYHVVRKTPVPGTGSWDYLTVDEGARRLYVSHGTQVEVLDVDSGAIVGQISNTPGVHGIAIASELGRGFVSYDFRSEDAQTHHRGVCGQEARRDYF